MRCAPYRATQPVTVTAVDGGITSLTGRPNSFLEVRTHVTYLLSVFLLVDSFYIRISTTALVRNKLLSSRARICPERVTKAARPTAHRYPILTRCHGLSSVQINRIWSSGDRIAFVLPNVYRLTRYVGVDQIPGTADTVL